MAGNGIFKPPTLLDPPAGPAASKPQLAPAAPAAAASQPATARGISSPSHEVVTENTVNEKVLGVPRETNPVLPTLGKLTMFAPNNIGGVRIPGGPIQGFLGSTALGTGAGWLSSKVVNMFKDDGDKKKRDRTRRWMLLGALGGGIPGGLAAYSVGKWSVPRYGVSGLWDAAQRPEPTEKPASYVPIGVTTENIIADPFMTPWQKAMSLEVLNNAAAEQQRGVVKFSDLMKGALGAGLGYMGGGLVASAIDSLFGISPGVSKFIKATGGVAGAGLGTGYVGF